MNILRQKDKKVQKGLFEKFADSSVIDKIHSDLPLNDVVQKILINYLFIKINFVLLL